MPLVAIVDDDEAVRDPIPAILVTSCAEERMRERALEAGLAGYLAKPFRSSELLACIRLAMHQWQPLPAAARDDALAIEED
jgi:DNA-binding response OmpR family regulator